MPGAGGAGGAGAGAGAGSAPGAGPGAGDIADDGGEADEVDATRATTSQEDELLIEVWDEDPFGAGDFLGQTAIPASVLRGAMPAMLNTPELRFQVDESRKFAAIDEVKARLTGDHVPAGVEVNATDGVRVNTPDGWWLLRASNTQDVLVARAESESEEGLARLVAQIDEQLAASGLERGPQAGH